MKISYRTSWFQAFYKLPTLEDVTRLRPWLFRIAHNKCIDHLRRHRGVELVPVEEDELDVEAVEEPAIRDARRRSLRYPRDIFATERACLGGAQRCLGLSTKLMTARQLFDTRKSNRVTSAAVARDCASLPKRHDGWRSCISRFRPPGLWPQWCGTLARISAYETCCSEV